MRKCTAAFVLFVFIAVSCGSERTSLTVRSTSWPETATVSIIHTAGVAARSSLYGSRTRLPVESGAAVRIRAAHPEYLAFLSDTLRFVEVGARFTLPSPIRRRRIGGWRLGLTLPADDPDSAFPTIIANVPHALTTVSPALAGDPALSEIAAEAHARGIEVTARFTLSTENRGKGTIAVDGAEVFGVDGIVADIAQEIAGDPAGVDALRRMIKTVHDRGMTFAVRTVAGCGVGGIDLPRLVGQIMTDAPRPEQPDELRIALRCSGGQALPSIEALEEKAAALVERRIPLTRVSFEFTLTAAKFILNNGGGLERVRIERGELEDLVDAIGDTAMIRMRDGTCRLGHGGFLYVYGDEASVARLAGRMREGTLARSGGIHLVYDGYGVSPTPSSIREIARGAGLD